MTIIVAAKIDDKIYIGSDRQVSFGPSKCFLPGATPKWQLSRDLGIGLSGDLSAVTKVQEAAAHLFSKYGFKPDMSIPSLRKLLTEASGTLGPCTSSDSPRFAAIIVRHSWNDIHLLDLKGGVVELNFLAVGSGETAADGAWQILRYLDMDPVEKVKRCIEAACAVDVYCGGQPFAACYSTMQFTD